MRITGALLALLGCETKDAATDSGTDTSDTAGAAHTGGTTDTTDTGGLPGGNGDGTYVGTFDVTVSESGIIVNTESCTADLTLVLDASQTPTVFGSGSCALGGTLGGRTFELTLESYTPVATVSSGPATVDYPGLPEPDLGMWDGAWSGGPPATLTGTTSGSWQMGEQAVDWMVTFSVTRSD